MKYLTPAFYTASGEGVDTSALSAVQLARLIARAESLIDRYCHLPTLAPTTVVDEQSQWNGQSRRIYYALAPVPLIAVTSCEIQVSTNPATGGALIATINPDDIALMPDLGYVEIVSFTAMTMGLTPVLINLGLTNVIARISYTTGWTLTDTETLTNGGDNLTYSGNRCLWDATQSIVVAKNGTTITSGFTVNAQDGVVTFSAQNLATDVITAAYTYHIPDPIRDAAIITTSMLTAESYLQTQGLTNLMTARNGRMYQLQRPQGVYSADLPPVVKDMLGDYRHLSLAAV